MKRRSISLWKREEQGKVTFNSNHWFGLVYHKSRKHDCLRHICLKYWIKWVLHSDSRLWRRVAEIWTCIVLCKCAMGFNNIQSEVAKHLREAWLSLWPQLQVWDAYFHRRPKPGRKLDEEHSQDKLKYYWYCAAVVSYCVMADFPPHWNTTFLSYLLTHQLKVCGLPAATVKSAIRGSQSKSPYWCHGFYFTVT